MFYSIIIWTFLNPYKATPSDLQTFRMLQFTPSGSLTFRKFDLKEVRPSGSWTFRKLDLQEVRLRKLELQEVGPSGSWTFRELDLQKVRHSGTKNLLKYRPSKSFAQITLVKLEPQKIILSGSNLTFVKLDLSLLELSEMYFVLHLCILLCMMHLSESVLKLFSKYCWAIV